SLGLCLALGFRHLPLRSKPPALLHGTGLTASSGAAGIAAARTPGTARGACSANRLAGRASVAARACRARVGSPFLAGRRERNVAEPFGERVLHHQWLARQAFDRLEVLALLEVANRNGDAG